jgi:hypothetical protein
MKLLGFSTSSIALILANLVPLYGAVFAGWNIFSIMFLFWLESAVIGFFTVRKMLKAEGDPASFAQFKINGKVVNQESSKFPNPFSAKLFYVPFFAFHYGMFMFVHLIFLVIFFGPHQWINKASSTSFDTFGILLGFASLVFSHAFSYYSNFIGKKEYQVVSADQLFMSPYPRIIVMHLTIIFGGMLMLMSGYSAAGLALMVILKIVTDLAAHLFEHSQMGRRLL